MGIYFFAQDCFFTWCRQSLKLSTGTVLSNLILRLMGCKVGKRTIIGSPLQASDWNAMHFGDDCMVNGFLQYHTFENMMFHVLRERVPRYEHSTLTGWWNHRTAKHRQVLNKLV